jgi:hypothetical protein
MHVLLKFQKVNFKKGLKVASKFDLGETTLKTVLNHKNVHNLFISTVLVTKVKTKQVLEIAEHALSVW